MALVARLLAVFRTHEAEPVRGTFAGFLGGYSVVIGVYADLYNAFHDADLLCAVSVGSRASCEVVVMSDAQNSGSA